MKRPLILAFAAGAALLAAGAAHAGNVQWSIGINLPPIGTVVSNGPIYVPAPAPVYYPAPAPVYRRAPGYYGPAAVVRAPVVVTPAPAWRHRGPPAYYGGGPRQARPVVIVAPRHDGWRDDRRRGRDRDGWRDDRRWDRDRDGRDQRGWPHR